MSWIYVTEPGAKFSKCGGRYIINGKRKYKSAPIPDGVVSNLE